MRSANASLSNVTAYFTTATSALTITEDTHNDNFTIKENANGTVTVAPGTPVVHPGVGVVPGSTIDKGSTPFTTPNAVTSITVTLPGTTNFDFVTLSGQGKTIPTTVKNVTVTATGANLTFAANNVDDSGNFVLSDRYTSSVNAVLTATVDNSSFATLSITQTGGSKAVVELGNDAIPSTVFVKEGSANTDSITVGNGDVFGATVLWQGVPGAPVPATSLGTSDTVSVTNAGDTKIDQNYANNQVYLGDADSSFTTVYLDVFTGFGGGAFVMARNTTVDFGSLFGIYTIDGGGSGNTYVDGGGNSGVTVDPANFNFSTLLTPVLTWADPADITYGTALDGTQLDATASVPGSFVYTPAAGTVLSAGANETLSVTFTPTDTTDYGPVTATAMINVDRATLLITANSATRVYGQQNPAFTVTYAGLTNGDSPSSLGGSLHFSTAATASSPVNTYSVVPGGLTSPNYAITFAGAKLVVTPASLTITANNQSRVYGQPNPPLTVYYQGFVNGDTPASLTAPVALSTPAVLASFAGSYPIFVGGAASPNYAIRLETLTERTTTVETTTRK